MVARAFERDSRFSLIAGPLVWSAHFLTLYVFTALACARGFFHDEILGIRLVPLVGSAWSLVAVALIVDALYLVLASLARRSRRRRAAAVRRTATARPAGGSSWPMPACCCRGSR